MKIQPIILCVVLCAGYLSTQGQCDVAVSSCQKNMDNSYISDGQVYWTVLASDETTEFQTVFFGGNTYRISVQGGGAEGNLIFRILDPNGNALFSNQKYNNAPYWDFRVDSTLPVTIEAQLDPTRAGNGCAVMLIGFKR